MDEDKNDKIAQFSAITGANPSRAQLALTSTQWNLDEAVELFYAAGDDQPDHSGAPSSPHHATPAPSSSDAHTGTAPNPSRRQPGVSNRKHMTLQDLQGVESEDDEIDDKNQDMFAGGEKSALAVQNPAQGPRNTAADHFKNIMNQARANRERPTAEDDDAEEPRSNHFTGRAQTLGGDDVESTVVEDPHASAPSQQRPSRVTRTLHLWADGVSIDDGPLFRFDDPQNQDMMTQINQGRAPLSLLNVQPNQEVDLNLIPHKDEDYVAPKKSYKPFSGQGLRLGSPTPGSSVVTAMTEGGSHQAVSDTIAVPAASTQVQAQPEVDENVPFITLQIRLGDGTRLQSRFNVTHNIGDVYDFVSRASPVSTQRPYALMTTFPSKELNDKHQTLAEISDFKRGGVVVQKWK